MITARCLSSNWRLGLLSAIVALAPTLNGQCPPPTSPAVPANGLTTTETHINFQWNPAGSNVTGYDLLVAQNGGTPTRMCFNSPSPNCSAILTPAHYEWFVRSFTNDSCPNGTESVHSTLDVIGCSTPVAPTTLTPDSGAATAASAVALAWSGGSADTYDVFLEQGSSCTTTTPLNAAPLPASTSSIVTGALVRGATYSWRVRASRGSTCGAPALSHCASFSVRSCDSPSTPSLVQPADGATNQPSHLTLTWTATAGAVSYNVWTRSGATGAFSLAGTSSGTSVSAAFPPSATVEWYVEGISGSCVTASAHRTFTTAPCGTAASPTALAPAGTISAGPIVFRWSAVSGALRYRLWLAPISGAFESIEETSDLTFTAHRPAGTYQWYVEAIGGDCPSTRSQTTPFVMSQASSCASTTPVLLAPPDGATVTGPVSFQWSALAGATRYEVWASLGDAAPVQLGATTVPTMTTDLAPGQIRWYVVVHVDGCDDVLTTASNLTITRPAACATDEAPLLIAPADDAEQLPSNIDFFWTNVAGAQSYQLWVAVDDAPATVLATTTSTRAQTAVPQGRIRWFVEVTFAGGCGSRRSAPASFRSNGQSTCSLPGTPALSVPGGAPSGTSYDLHWTPQANVDHYEVFEWTDQTGSPALLKTNDVVLTVKHDVAAATRYHYRVRAASNCGAGTGALSADASIVVAPASTQAIVPFGNGAFTRTLFVPGQGSAVQFTATSDRPWLTIAPSSGTLPPGGITLTLTADLTTLDAGDSVANVKIDTTSGSSSGHTVPTAATATSPVSVTLVTPAAPASKSSATSGSLILPAVAHLDGLAAFRSDVRLANTSARPQRYQLTFTPSGTDATLSAVQTSLQVDAGATVALNDLLANFFSATNSGSVSGSLEIKPIVATSDTSPSPNVTFVSSRTFSVTPAGTSGQFIPALPLSRFAGSAGNALFSKLLIPQISQSGAFRTNIGLVEGSAQPAHVVLSFFDAAGNLLSQLPVDLLPGEHRQLNGVVTSTGALANAVRMEAEVTSARGLVTAYASVLDQTTSDPMLVDAVAANSLQAKHYTVPGVAALDAGNGNRWRSDMRVYNASASSQPANVSFTPQGAAAPAQSIAVTLNAGEVRSFDDVVRATFGSDGQGGSIAVATTDPSALAVTARTYFDTGKGTFGQYIPAFTETGGSGPGDRAQQILQVEQSDNYRTNLGLVELSGAPATVLVTALVPELKISPAITLTLPANGFVQYGSILAQLGLSNVYNGRLSVKVTSSTGRVAGYGCLIDNASGDPTYIPSQ